MPERCGKPTGVYDVTCARDRRHDGGCVGPFYRDAQESESCGCVGYQIRTDYGTGIEHDIDVSGCAIHGPQDAGGNESKR